MDETDDSSERTQRQRIPASRQDPNDPLGLFAAEFDTDDLAPPTQGSALSTPATTNNSERTDEAVDDTVLVDPARGSVTGSDDGESGVTEREPQSAASVDELHDPNAVIEAETAAVRDVVRGTAQPVVELSGAKPGSEKPGSEKPGSEKPGTERPSDENVRREKPDGESNATPNVEASSRAELALTHTLASLRRFRRPALLIAGTVAFLSLFNVIIVRPFAERDIEKRVRAVLALEDAKSIEVSARGQTIRLRGAVVDEAAKKRIVALAASRVGVSAVDDQLVVDPDRAVAEAVGAPPSAGAEPSDDTPDADATDAAEETVARQLGDPEPTIPPERVDPALPVRKAVVEAIARSGQVQFSGEVPTRQAADLLRGRAVALFGEPNVSGELVVSEVIEEAPDLNDYRRVGQLAAIIASLEGADVTFTYNRGVIDIRGVVQRAIDLQLLQGEVSNLVPTATDRTVSVTVNEAGVGSTRPPGAIAIGKTDAPLAISTRERILSVIADRSIAFESDRAVLTDAGRNVVFEIAAAMGAVTDPSVRFEIAGFTDDRGDTARNQELSTRRAEAVRDLLVQQGVQANRLVVNGYGEASPIAENSTEAGRARNRRIEIRVGVV